jgi:hypothetical protein
MYQAQYTHSPNLHSNHQNALNEYAAIRNLKLQMWSSALARKWHIITRLASTHESRGASNLAVSGSSFEYIDMTRRINVLTIRRYADTILKDIER